MTKKKTDKVINYLEIDNINTHVLCFSGHHKEEQDLLHHTLAGYILGSSFCHQNLKEYFLFIKTSILERLIFNTTIKKSIWKFVPLN
jgi:hypothetical protein